MIYRIEALSYRCFRYIKQELQPFQILVGPNAAGKSTFLDIIALIGDIINAGIYNAVKSRAPLLEDLLWKGEGDRFELAVEVEIPQDLIQKAGNGKYSACRYEITIGKGLDNEIAILAETLWLKDKGDIGSEGIPEQFKMFPFEVNSPQSLEKKGKDWRKIVNKTEKGNDYFRSEKTEWNNIFKIGPMKSALANLPEDEEKFHISTWLKHILMLNIQQISLNSLMMRIPASPLHGKKWFAPDGSNLPLIVNSLKKEQPKRFNLWIHHIRTVLADLKDIEVVERPEDRHLYLVGLYESGVRVPAWLLSDGTLRLLALTLLAYFPVKDQIYLIEEPENGIHPRAAEAVYQSLSSIYEAQVFLATHSPIIIGVAQPRDILCFAKNPSGSVSVIRGTEHPELRDWKGSPNLSVLYASGVLG